MKKTGHNRVHILPPDVISKIAAGEVIERPASAVKELVENAIDAGSDTIELHLKDAGKSSIRIKDNGHGIEQQDLEKIFHRHATSKIENAEDLTQIQSLGFRGEALYSIASIADVYLQSKTQNQDSGWEIHLRGGKQLNYRPCSFTESGTEVEIKELFYNTPARKKFLKTDTTEIHQILNTFIPYTLIHPNIRFLLKHQDKTLLDLAPTANLIDRIASVLHLDQKHILENKDHSSIRLLLGDINIQRNRRDMQFIFINNRPVQNKSISFHMNQIYRLVLPPDISPFFAVYINIPPEDIDVNIHPTKREVKIKNEQSLCSFLRRICEQTLMHSGQIKQTAHYASQVRDDKQNFSEYSLMGTPMLKEPLESSGVIRETPLKDYAYPKIEAKIQEFFLPETNLFDQNKNSLQNKLKQARYIGAFMDKFQLFETGNSLLVVDQHAAAERITYEQLIQQMQNGNLEVQHLLSPLLLRLTVQEMLFWEEIKEELEKVGLSTSQWDKETIAIHTHPQLLKDPEKAARHLLAGETIAKCDHDTIARRACRSSVMAGDRLTKEKAEFQREQLLKCLDPFICPHGRPTVIEISENFLNKQFLRS